MDRNPEVLKSVGRPRGNSEWPSSRHPALFGHYISPRELVRRRAMISPGLLGNPSAPARLRSPPHAGVGEPLEFVPASGGERRQAVAVAGADDGVGDTPAASFALRRRASFGHAGVLAGAEKAGHVRLRRKRAPGGQRREETDQDRLMHEIDWQAVPASEADRARRRRLGSPTLRPFQPRQDAWQAREAEAEKDDARPRQKRAPVERIRQRLGEPEP